MEPVPEVGDALGEALLAHLNEGEEAGVHIIERDDGYLHADPATLYFTAIGDWFPVENRVPDLTQGRVLDIGAGGGRFAVELQRRGHDVLALDVSAGCLEVCRRLGVEQTFYGTIFELQETSPEPFDSFLLMGHNLGLLSGPDHAPKFLEALRDLANPGALIIGSNRDPLATEDPIHLGYHQRNRERGRLPGQLMLRVRWRQLATPWFDYWFLTIEDLAQIAGAAGWTLVDSDCDDSNYLAVFRLVSD